MIYIKLLLVSSCFISTIIAAPTTDSASTTTVSSESSSANPITTHAPTSDQQPNSLAVGSTPDQKSSTNSTTNFSCHGRAIGYYADVERDCKLYHFCMLGDYEGEPVYQRISYLCLNETVFDQQALDCVEPSKMLDGCKESESHYELSNTILRKAVLSKELYKNKTVVTSTISNTATAEAATTTTTTSTKETQ